MEAAHEMLWSFNPLQNREINRHDNSHYLKKKKILLISSLEHPMAIMLNFRKQETSSGQLRLRYRVVSLIIHEM